MKTRPPAVKIWYDNQLPRCWAITGLFRNKGPYPQHGPWTQHRVFRKKPKDSHRW